MRRTPRVRQRRACVPTATPQDAGRAASCSCGVVGGRLFLWLLFPQDHVDERRHVAYGDGEVFVEVAFIFNVFRIFHDVVEVAPGRCAGVCLFAACWDVEGGGIAKARISTTVIRIGVRVKRIDIFETCALIKHIASDAGDGIGDGDARQAAAVSVFANYFISAICKLNGRKVVS